MSERYQLYHEIMDYAARMQSLAEQYRIVLQCSEQKDHSVSNETKKLTNYYLPADVIANITSAIEQLLHTECATLDQQLSNLLECKPIPKIKAREELKEELKTELLQEINEVQPQPQPKPRKKRKSNHLIVPEEDIIALWNQGHTIMGIALQYNVSYQCIYQRIKELKDNHLITANHKPVTIKQEAKEAPDEEPKEPEEEITKPANAISYEEAIELASKNLRLTGYVIKPFLRKFPDATFDELVAIANLGLWKAALNFDKSKGYQFSTLAYPYMRNSLLQYTYRDQKKWERNIPLSTEVSISENGDTTELGDMLNQEEYYGNQYERFETNETLKKALATLTTKERELLCQYYGAFGYPKLSQVALAKKLHVSQTQVSRLIHQALEKAKEAAEA